MKVTNSNSNQTSKKCPEKKTTVSAKEKCTAKKKTCSSKNKCTEKNGRGKLADSTWYFQNYWL